MARGGRSGQTIIFEILNEQGNIQVSEQYYMYVVRSR